jgi:hypothetical protein
VVGGGFILATAGRSLNSYHDKTMIQATDGLVPVSITD